MGAGIVFTRVEERYRLILDKWLAALRDSSKGVGRDRCMVK
jgi:hypothetical protein